MQYVDFTFDNGKYGLIQQYTGNNSLILAVRNILLSRPGNFPFTPGIGMDIEKFQFDFLDEETLGSIKSGLETQMDKYLPSTNSVETLVRKVEDPDSSIPMVGISVSTIENGEMLTANFLLRNREKTLVTDVTDNIIDIYNEIL